eukprot:6186157-Pleurochrysis_carterae.AAC.2
MEVRLRLYCACAVQSLSVNKFKAGTETLLVAVKHRGEAFFAFRGNRREEGGAMRKEEGGVPISSAGSRAVAIDARLNRASGSEVESRGKSAELRGAQSSTQSSRYKAATAIKFTRLRAHACERLKASERFCGCASSEQLCIKRGWLQRWKEENGNGHLAKQDSRCIGTSWRQVELKCDEQHIILEPHV